MSRVLVGGSLVVAGAGWAVGGETQAVAASTDDGWRGSVVSVTPVVRMSRTDVRRYLGKEDPRLGSPQARRGVSGFRVLYRTISPSGRPIVASGVVVLPRDDAKVLRAVSFTHGTHTGRDSAGSVAEDGQSRVAAIYYAAAGYAGVAPDYLGLGLGEGKHPYMDAASEASASLDMLRAARTVAGRQGRRLDRRVLVTGFSQGGHAAMALGRQLHQSADPYLRLGALAPVSGPYDPHVQIPASLDGSLDPRGSAFYLAYATVAWNRLHRIYEKPSEVFQAPHDTAMERLFDGRHDEQEIFPQLPTSPEQLLTSRYLARLRQPSGGLLRAFQAVDGTCDWAPRAPVRLYAAAGDEQVSFGNTHSCIRTLRRHGARPQVVAYGADVQHIDTLYRGLTDTLRWFQAIA